MNSSSHLFQVGFDESGNTGQDLLNSSQPVFALASVCLPSELCQELLRPIRGAANEAKFTQVKKRERSKNAFLDLISSSNINSNFIKVFLVHKPFLAITKFLDIIIEPSAYKYGLDFFKNGLNIATANLFYMVMSTFCGKTRSKHYISAFVKMIRSKSKSSVDNFFRLNGLMYAKCKDEQFCNWFSVVESERLTVELTISNYKSTELDPIIPCFILLCDKWGRQFETEYDVIHDESKSLSREKEILEILSDRTEKEVEVGYDRRKAIFPLRVRKIESVNSDREVVQLADLFAGAAAHYGRGKLMGKIDPLTVALEERNFMRFIIHNIWPSDAITPEDLGITDSAGTSSVDHVANLIERKRIGSN